LNKRISHLVIGLFFLATILLILNATTVAAIDETAKIEAANTSINQAYVSILAAEKSGGNITSLVNQLNIANDLLSQAENNFHAGIIENVSNYADNARLIANQVNTDAIVLQKASDASARENLFFTAFFTLDALVIWIFVIFVVWRKIKSRYVKRLYDLKPEVKEETD
jgi:hypothetical protein